MLAIATPVRPIVEFEATSPPIDLTEDEPWLVLEHSHASDSEGYELY